MTNWQRNHRVRRNISLLLMCAALCILATACFRDASEGIDSQPVAREAASATAVSPTVAATAPPPTLTVEVLFTEEPPDTFALTATALIARLTEAVAAQSTSLPADVASESDSTGSADNAPVVQATPIPLVRATALPGEDCIHEIRSGETMFMLSLAYGSTVEEIAAASGIDNPDRIAIGQRITIPGCGTTGFAPPPTSLPSPTLPPSAIEPTAVAEEVDISAAEDDEGFSPLVVQAQNTILSNAQADDFSAQAAIATPRPNYTVQQNDTLLGIALQFDTTLAELAALNNITDVNSLRVGDELRIP